MFKEDPLSFASNTSTESSMFREIGATHYVPYHLILKWGALYHRYKKYIIDGIDIVSGCTQTIDGGLFFDDLSKNGTNDVLIIECKLVNMAPNFKQIE